MSLRSTPSRERAEAAPGGPTPRARNRLEVLDAVRGSAVVAMLMWHTSDSWLDETARSGTGFAVARVVGGLAAPLFVLLAGVARGLSEREPTRATLVAGLRRALSIVVAGYGLRTFSWGVDHGAVADPALAPVVCTAAVGLALTYAGLGGRGRGSVRLALGASGLALFAFAVTRMTASDARIVLRLDVLQGIGAALIVVVLVLHVSARSSRSARVAIPLFVALVVGLAAPHVAGWPPPPGPIRVWDYVARFAVDPARSGAGFPLVPWLGYALIGSAVGRALAGRSPSAGALSLPLAGSPVRVLLVSLAVVVVVFEGGPIATFTLERAEWLRGIDRLTFNTLVGVSIASGLACLPEVAQIAGGFLTVLGRHSLLIYAVHLEIAYGLPGSLIARAFGWGTWALVASLLLLLMVLLAQFIERIETRRPRDHERSASSATLAE